MTKRVLVVFTMYLCTFPLSAAFSLTDSEKAIVKEEVEQAFQALVEAAKSLDADSYLAFFDDAKFTGLNADGTVTHTLKEFARLYKRNLPLFESYEYLEFFRVKVTVIDTTTAILVNEFQADIKVKNGELLSVSGGGSQVWQKQGQDWKLIHVASSAPRN